MTIFALMLMLFIYTDQTIASSQSPEQLLQEIAQLTSHQHYQEAADRLEKYLLLDSSNQQIIDAYLAVLKKIKQPDNLVDTKTHWNTNTQISLQAGGSSNLNRAPTNKNILITLPEGGDLEAELTEQQRPQQGYGVDLGIKFNATKEINKKNSVGLSLQLDHRNTNKDNFTDYLRITSGINLWHNLSTTQAIDVSLIGDILQYDNNTRYYDISLISRYIWQYSKNCQPNIGIDLQWQHQKNNSDFDKLYAGANIETNCNWLGSQYTARLTLGNEFALSDRPGDNRMRLAISLAHTRQLNFLHTQDHIRNNLDLNYQQDKTGYSPFLNNNKIRKIRRLSLGTAYRYPVYLNHSQWWATLKIEWEHQKSNLPLFQFNSLEGWVGIEVNW